MKLIEWSGLAHVRVVRRSDFESRGIDHDDVEFDRRRNKGRAEVSDDAADFLATLKGFAIIGTAEDEAPEAAESDESEPESISDAEGELAKPKPGRRSKVKD